MDSNDAIAPQAGMFAAMGEAKQENQKLREIIADLIRRVDEALEQAATRSPP